MNPALQAAINALAAGRTKTFQITSRSYVRNASVTFTIDFQSDGDLVTNANTGSPAADDWIKTNPQSGLGSNYSIRFTRTSGVTDFGGSLRKDIWYRVNTTRQYSLTGDGQTITGYWEVAHHSDTSKILYQGESITMAVVII